MSDYFDPSRHEPAIGPLEDQFCGMLDDFQVDVARKAWFDENPPQEPDNVASYQSLKKSVTQAHDTLVAFVADLETKLASANGSLECIEGIVKCEKSMQQRLTAIEDIFCPAIDETDGSRDE